MCNILFTYAKKGQITISKSVIGMNKTINYGCLYNWWAAVDSRNIAASGWHVPTESDFDTLDAYLGGVSVAGGKLKETGTTHWETPNAGADNSAGFYGRGSGMRYTDGSFQYLTQYCYLWASTGFSTVANNRYLSAGSALSGGNNTGIEKYRGCGIRLLADSGSPTSYTGNDGQVYSTVTIGTQTWITANLIETKYRNGDTIPFETNGTTFIGLTTGAMCYYNNTQSNSYSETESTLDDNTSFSVTITGQRAVNPKIEGKTFSQNSPAVFTKLPYDTYVITEDSLTGYTLDSITPSTITLWGGNKADESTIINIKD